MKILFLDDNEERIKSFRSRIPWADICKTSSEAISMMSKNGYDIVFLDHDLGGEEFCHSSREDTGAGVARWMVENQPAVQKVIVHSCNPIGASNIIHILSEGQWIISKMPFISTEFKNAVSFYGTKGE